MLILVRVIDDNEPETGQVDVLLQLERIVSVVPAENYTGNSVILYREDRKLVQYEIGMGVQEFYQWLRKQDLNSFLQ